MDFKGYETLDSPINCAYGGLFILLYKWRHNPSDNNNPITICSNINSEIVLPYEVYTPSIRMVIVFKIFTGYTNGSTDLTISYDSDCIGPNYKITTDTRCNSKTNWWDQLKDHTNEKTQSPTCSDFWLTHLVPYLLDSEHCSFPFTMNNKLRRTVGSFKFMASSSIVYQNFTSVISSHQTSYFNMTIKSFASKDFPFNPATKKSIYNIKLPTTSKPTFLFNPTSKLHVNLTGDFQHFIFLIRIQIVENVICTSVEDHHPLDITQSYTLNSNLSDIYLSRIYPYNGYITKSLRYVGHSHGSCRVLVYGQRCSHSSSYKVIRIHYRPNLKLEASHRIQISMKKNTKLFVFLSLEC